MLELARCLIGAGEEGVDGAEEEAAPKPARPRLRTSGSGARWGVAGEEGVAGEPRGSPGSQPDFRRRS